MEDLNNGSYQPDPLREKQVLYPKRRIVQVPSLNDKIVQHVICDGYAYEPMTKPLIREASANTRGRGTDYGRDILVKHLRAFWRKYKRPPYILKCDVHSFFASIPHDRLLQLIDRYIDNPIVKSQMEAFVALTDQGSPLGLQQSQLTSNLYLSELDHKLKERLGVEFYGRHMDDFYILSDSRAWLEEIWAWIRRYLDSIGLELNPKTNIFYRSFDYIGFRFIVSDTGKVIVRLSPGKLKSKRRHLKKQAGELASGKKTPEQLEASYFGWRVHAFKAKNARTQIINMDTYFNGLLQQAGYRLCIYPYEGTKIKWRVSIVPERTD